MKKYFKISKDFMRFVVICKEDKRHIGENMIEIKNEKYYTTKEVAEKFGVTIGTISKWAQKGNLSPIVISKRRFLFSETSIENFLKQGEK